MRPTLAPDSPYHMPLAGRVEDPVLREHLARVPPEVQPTVLAAGLEPMLGELLRERASHADELTLSLLSQKQVLASRLSALDAQLAAATFEVDCTGDALEKLLHDLERRAHARELKLTIASLVVGAVGGVIAGVWEGVTEESRGPAFTAAGSAALAAGLGVGAFARDRRVLEFMHTRNVLAPIFHGEDPTRIYPSFVFRLLTQSREPGQPTPRDELLAEWRTLIARSVAEPERARAEALLFGEGGRYDEKLLELREQMLDTLESRLGAFYRELEVLERYIARIAESD